MNTKLLSEKRVLIVGLASKLSIAYGIALAMKKQGAELAFTYQNEKLKQRVMDLSEATFGHSLCLPCDVTKDDEIDQLFSQLKKHWGRLDVLVHSVAYAPSDQLGGDYLACINREGFRMAHEISSYSLAALAKAALPLMEGYSGALLTLTYLGSNFVVSNYNVMGLAKASLEANVRYLATSLGPKGIRVNAISAGPIRTLAASGIKNFRKLLASHAKIAPLRQVTTLEHVGNAAVFLCSDMSAGITGEVLYVDGGFHIVRAVENAE